MSRYSDTLVRNLEESIAAKRLLLERADQIEAFNRAVTRWWPQTKWAGD